MICASSRNHQPISPPAVKSRKLTEKTHTFPVLPYSSATADGNDAATRPSPKLQWTEKDERADGIESLSVSRLKLAAAIADALDAEG